MRGSDRTTLFIHGMFTRIEEIVDKDFSARKCLCAADQRLGERVLAKLNAC